MIGAVVGGAVGGTRAKVSESAVAPATVTVIQVTLATVTSTATLSAASPSPSNCVWEGTAPFCDGKCHTGFTQINEDNCGNGDCCATGFKVYCCQE